ncbi:hypothetical protein [Geobacter sp. AOG1]|uniref:hypothetical protein n=1 Tax=Geobacter sp. AOG1 TaxID=1566346 RepID=UPI001CC5F9B3|nr:hypothetical protein [Geobacter sp. AOG1]GFE56411.1 hypothetical protein AOG1_02900 [Geobacter sp. AOG1]
MLINQEQRLQMIEQAMKDKAPKMFRELKAAGKLQSFLGDHEAAMMESFYEAYAEARTPILSRTDPDQLKREQDLFAAQREAWDDAIATWTEFQDETTESIM